MRFDDVERDRGEKEGKERRKKRVCVLCCFFRVRVLRPVLAARPDRERRGGEEGERGGRKKKRLCYFSFLSSVLFLLPARSFAGALLPDQGQGERRG